MTKKCFACEEVVISIDEGVCSICLKTNKDVLSITQNLDKFKKEFNGLFYADTWEHWYVNAKELEFFTKRWGL